MKSPITSRIWIFAIFFLIAAIPSKSQNGLVAWYKFDGNAADSSGSNYHGTVTGTIPATDMFGNPTGALYFNGSTDLITLPAEFDFPQRTICFWVNPVEFVAGSGMPYDSDNPTLVYGHTWFSLVEQVGIDRIALGVGSQVQYFDRALINRWTHLACVVDADTVTLYVQGSPVSKAPNNSFTCSTSGLQLAYVGCNRQHNYHLKGYMDDLKIFNRALTVAEIQAMTAVLGVREEPFSFGLYPNPTEGKISLSLPEGSGNEKTEVVVFNMLGQPVIRQSAANNPLVLDCSRMPDGIYMVRISSKAGQVTRLFEKR